MNMTQLIMLLLPWALVEAQQESHSWRYDLETSYRASVQQFHDEQLADNPVDSAFYETPTNFSKSTGPGQLLKLQTVSNTSLSRRYAYPPGLTLYRILYTSEDINRNTVPASGFLLLPYDLTFLDPVAPRTLVWTHGTSGFARDCAPSADRGLFYNWSALYALALNGYVILAPDYAGLGTNTPFHYMSGSSHANDATNMLLTVRRTLPFLGIQKWATIGHSEGGMVSWITNLRQKSSSIGGFVGSVSLAPAMDFARTMARGLLSSGYRQQFEQSIGGKMYSLFMLESISRVQGRLDPERFLTPLGTQLLWLVTQSGCDATACNITRQFSLDDIYSDYSWANSTESEEWASITMNTSAEKLAGPMIIIQGQRDVDVPPEDTYHAFQTHCAIDRQAPVRLHLYPEIDHMGITWAAYTDILAHLNSFFKGDGFDEPCVVRTIDASTTLSNTHWDFAFALGTSSSPI